MNEQVTCIFFLKMRTTSRNRVCHLFGWISDTREILFIARRYLGNQKAFQRARFHAS